MFDVHRYIVLGRAGDAARVVVAAAGGARHAQRAACRGVRQARARLPGPEPG